MSNSDEKGRAGAQPSANWDLMFHPLPDCKKLGIDESYANPEAPQDLGRETTGVLPVGEAGWSFLLFWAQQQQAISRHMFCVLCMSQYEVSIPVCPRSCVALIACLLLVMHRWHHQNRRVFLQYCDTTFLFAFASQSRPVRHLRIQW